MPQFKKIALIVLTAACALLAVLYFSFTVQAAVARVGIAYDIPLLQEPVAARMTRTCERNAEDQRTVMNTLNTLIASRQEQAERFMNEALAEDPTRYLLMERAALFLARGEYAQAREYAVEAKARGTAFFEDPSDATVDGVLGQIDRKLQEASAPGRGEPYCAVFANGEKGNLLLHLWMRGDMPAALEATFVGLSGAGIGAAGPVRLRVLSLGLLRVEFCKESADGDSPAYVLTLKREGADLEARLKQADDTGPGAKLTFAGYPPP